MRIDRPCCSLESCKHYSDGNCLEKEYYDACDYAKIKNTASKLLEELEKEYPLDWGSDFDDVACFGYGLCYSIVKEWVRKYIY